MKQMYLPEFSVRMHTSFNQKNKEKRQVSPALFRVPSYLTKCQIKSYFEVMYGQKVDKIRTIKQQGKMKKVGRKFPFRTVGYKKAILLFK